MSGGGVEDMLTTARLQLRPWRVEDAAALRRVLDEADAHLRPWIRFMRDEPRTLEQTAARLASYLPEQAAGTILRYGIWCGGSLIAETLLMPYPAPAVRELGFWLHPAWVGQGYALEASSALSAFAFDQLQVERLHLYCDVRNGPSNALAQRLGASLERVEVLEDPGGSLPFNVWTLLRPR